MDMVIPCTGKRTNLTTLEKDRFELHSVSLYSCLACSGGLPTATKSHPGSTHKSARHGFVLFYTAPLQRHSNLFAKSMAFRTASLRKFLSLRLRLASALF
jgi:hypothetical protein